MDWFRVYHGISTDPMLHKASRKARVSRGLMVGAWVAVLEVASQTADRGDIGDLDAETLAFLIDQPGSVAKRILAAMAGEGLIHGGKVRSWSVGRVIEGRPDTYRWAALRRLVLGRDPHECLYCGDTSGPFDVDHKTPVARGGSNDPANLALACVTCNRSKRDRTADEWMGVLCRG